MEFHDFPGVEHSFLKFHDFPGCVETPYTVWHGDVMITASDLPSKWHCYGFYSCPFTFTQCLWASCSHTCASVTKQYNLLVKWRWCSAAGKVAIGRADCLGSTLTRNADIDYVINFPFYLTHSKHQIQVTCGACHNCTMYGIGMCRMDFSSLVRFGFEKNRGFDFGSEKNMGSVFFVHQL